MNVYEVIVDRRLTNRFLVEARTATEAAATVGTCLADGFGDSEEVELSRRMLAPKVVKGAGPQEVLDFADSLHPSGDAHVEAWRQDDAVLDGA